MKVKALISFSGIISMQIGETRDITNEEIVEDLKQAGYVKTVGKVENVEEKNEQHEEKNETQELTENKEVVTDEN